MANLTKAQCVTEIRALDKLIDNETDRQDFRLAYLEQRIWWQERLGELITCQPTPWPGRKFHR
jgi:hypothetical protein